MWKKKNFKFLFNMCKRTRFLPVFPTPVALGRWFSTPRLAKFINESSLMTTDAQSRVFDWEMPSGQGVAGVQGAYPARRCGASGAFGA